MKLSYRAKDLMKIRQNLQEMYKIINVSCLEILSSAFYRFRKH